MTKDITTLESFLDGVRTSDTTKRLKVADDVAVYLSNDSNSVDFHGTDTLIDSFTAWAGSSNFKISQCGLEILEKFVDRLGGGFKSNLNSVLPTVVDRLGDSKPQIREAALRLISKCMDPGSSPQAVLELLLPYYSHKNWRVREQLLVSLIQTVNTFGSQQLLLSKVMPSLCKLLGDPNSKVREAAIDAVVEIYRHVGERVRNDLCKKGVPAARLTTIYSRFDQCLRDGTMKVSVEALDVANGEIVSNAATSKTKSPLRRSASLTAPRRKGGMERTNLTSSTASSGGGPAGAVAESDLISAWDDIPLHRFGQTYSAREASDELTKINTCLSDGNNAWEQRVAALKQLRSVVKYSEYEHIKKMVKDLENCLRISLKDLRSSVTKEACTTLSFMSAKFGMNFDYLADTLMPAFIYLIPNSAKIMSTSANAAIRLIIKHTASPRLISQFVSSVLTNKNKDIRRRCAEYIILLLETWDTSCFKSNVAILEESIRKGVGDADAETRAGMRRAYWHFEAHYPDRANMMMEGFDSSKQKLLQSDKNLLKAGISSAPMPSFGRVKTTKSVKSRNPSATDSDDIVSRSNLLPQRRPPSGASRAEPSSSQRTVPMPAMQRSASHLDGRSFRTPQLQGRQKSCDDFRAKSAARSRATSASVVSRRPATSASNPPPASPQGMNYPPAPKFSRERSEDYMTYRSPNRTKIPTPRKPHSRAGSRSTSRDPSPNRGRTNSQSALGYTDRRDKINGNGTANGKHVTETELWSAYEKSTTRRRFDSVNSTNNDGGSDESETSSICSEKSGGSFINKKGNAVTTDIAEITRLLNSQSWSDRRDGLASLQTFLRSQRHLTDEEISRFRDSFNKFFTDPHNKVYSLFLNVVSDFIVGYKNNLHDWLFVLLTRLLHKLGTEMLPSLHAKVTQVLDVVKDSFPYDHQFQILTKYITDRSQTPSLKMKVAILQFLLELISSMDPNDFKNSGETRPAVTKIITWTSEPKSPDVRKEAAAVIVALFELNTPEMSMMMSVLPSSLRDGASKVLHLHLGHNTPAKMSSSSPSYNDRDQIDSAPHTAPQARDPPAKVRPGYRSISPPKVRLRESPTTTPRSYTDDSDKSTFNTPGGNKISLVQKLQFGSPGDSSTPEPPYAQVQSSPRYQGNESKLSNQENNTSTSSYSSQFSLSKVTPPHYDPKQYEDQESSLTGESRMVYTSPEMFRVADGAEEPDKQTESTMRDVHGRGSTSLDQIRNVLSAIDDDIASEEMKNSLLELIKLTRSSTSPGLENGLAQLLPIVFRFFKHREVSLRSLAVRVVREIIRSQPSAYVKEINAMVMLLLELQRDTENEVSKTAEECCTLIAELQNPNMTVDAVCPVIERSPFPINHSAIKMLNVVVDNCSRDILSAKLTSVCPPLLKLYDHEESTVRKACVFCLVAIHNVVGVDALMPHLKDLAGSKMRLLELYIKRSRGSTV